MKISRFAIASAVLLVAFAVGCRKSDLRTVTIDVPDMKNQACAEIVTRSIAQEMAEPRNEGFNGRVQSILKSGRIRADLGKRTVTVTYESLARSLKNVEFSIAKAGFRANDIPADSEAQAALPTECR